jgi:hypothetical protein
MDFVNRRTTNVANDLYFIIIKNDVELEETFTENISQFLESDDVDAITGHDVGNKSIYLTFVDDYKLIKLLQFFKKYKVLIKFGKVDNIIDFINNNKDFFELYLEERNNIILNNYIQYNITKDNILERISLNSLEYLLPVELDVLKQKNK